MRTMLSLLKLISDDDQKSQSQFIFGLLKSAIRHSHSIFFREIKTTAKTVLNFENKNSVFTERGLYRFFSFSCSRKFNSANFFWHQNAYERVEERRNLLHSNSSEATDVLEVETAASRRTAEE